MKSNSTALKVLKSTDRAERILLKLKAAGHRVTKTRTLTVQLLNSASGPLPVSELIGGLKKSGRTVNKTTVYRELQFLMEEAIVHEIDLLEGQKRYELADPDHHHHHLMCTQCKSVTCVEMDNDLDELENSIRKKYQFIVSGHVLEFFGICSRCI